MSVYRYLDTQILEVRNSLITLNTGVTTASPSDAADIGVYGIYNDAGTLKSAGLFRDHLDGEFKLFINGSASIDPTGTITAPTVAADFGSLTVNNLLTQGDATISGNLTVLGAQTTIGSVTLTTTDNIIATNTSPSALTTDGGLVSTRYAGSVVAHDTAKISGTASAATLASFLTLATGTSVSADYYKGWIVKLGGDVTGTATVLSSTSGVNPILALDVAGSGPITTSTTYQLFNKSFVGPIWQESTQRLTFFGIPKENLSGVISTTDSAGNVADYIDIAAGNTYVHGNLHIDGYITASLNTTDNLVVANYNAGSLDSGFVSQRSATLVATDDTAQISNVAIQTNYVSGSTTLLITNAATGTDYYKGWVIGYNANTGNAVTVVASTEAAGTHTLTLSAGFPTALTAGTDTIKLWNRRYVGPVFHEGSQTFNIVGFPRELNEGEINPDAPVNGNVPTFVDVKLHDLVARNITYTGTLTGTGGTVLKTITYTTGQIISSTDLTNYDIFYFDTGANATFTLDSVFSMSFLANTSKVLLFVNISSANINVTLAANVSDTIEGLTSLLLKKKYSKTCLVGSDQLTNAWTIKG
jgi:hypothetical protein